jgi:hypothetical protein
MLQHKVFQRFITGNLISTTTISNAPPCGQVSANNQEPFESSKSFRIQSAQRIYLAVLIPILVATSRQRARHLKNDSENIFKRPTGQTQIPVRGRLSFFDPHYNPLECPVRSGLAPATKAAAPDSQASFTMFT